MRVKKRGSSIYCNVSSSTFINLMSEWKSRTGEYLTRDHDREPNIFPSLILCENLIKKLFYYTFFETKSHFSLSLQKFESASQTRGLETRQTLNST